MATGNMQARIGVREFNVPAGSMARLGERAGYRQINMPDGVLSEVIAEHAMSDTLGAGANVVVAFPFVAQVATGNIRFQVEIATITDNTSAWNIGDNTKWGTAVLATVAVPSAAGQAKVATFTVTNAQAGAPAAGSFFAIRISRLGTDALDTAVTDIQIVGAVSVKEA